jgi:predicted kinase
LSKAAEQGSLHFPFYEDLADEIIRYHRTAPILEPGNGAARMDAIIVELCKAFEKSGNVIGINQQARFSTRIRSRIDEIRHRLEQRAKRGFVRRCHGDLHLQNIIVLSGGPVLFDALEFNEDLATIDVLYDLAFLIMDLEARGMRGEANTVFNRYVVKSADSANIAGLEALPLFLACRAAIRAMVAITRMHQAAHKSSRITARNEAFDYFRAALGFLERRRPKLICVGGLSGTGKTTLARQLAPLTGRAPGALHLRSDIDRKTLFGVEETHRLDASAYTVGICKKIYARLIRKAQLGLLAGSDVIVDAVFQNPDVRNHVEQIALQAGASFTGLWLDADERSMTNRISERGADASDATPDVVRQQLAKPTGQIHWHRIDAAGTPDDTLENCLPIIKSARFTRMIHAAA